MIYRIVVIVCVVLTSRAAAGLRPPVTTPSTSSALPSVAAAIQLPPPRAKGPPMSIGRALGNSSFTAWYGNFLDNIIGQLDTWYKELDDPSAADLQNIACTNSFNSFARHLTSSWAMKMIDSSTKIQSGLLTGNLHDLGQYDECVGAESTVDDDDPMTIEFTGQHCLVSFNFHVPNNTITLDGTPTRVMDLFGSDWIPLTVGQCFPSHCTPQFLEMVINDALAGADEGFSMLNMDIKVSVSIDENDCHTKEREPFDLADWVVGGIVLFFIAYTLCCTLFDYYYLSKKLRTRPPNIPEELILAFSVYTNGGKLLDTNYPADAMTCVNGMKFFSICWVVLGHKYRYLITQPLINLLDFPSELKNWGKMIILSGPLSVDTFFLIGGLLNMYSFCLMREKSRRYTPLDTIMAYVHRYLRLTPSYVVMMAITATWLYRAGDGPYWDRMVKDQRDFCRNSYWQNLVYLNNYLNPDTYCMMQSWYLAADMQMYFLSPFVVYPLWRWPIIGFIEIAILTVASIIAPLLVSYFYQIAAPIPLTTDAIRSSHEMAWLYLPTHTKTVSYVVGILAGYLLYNLKKEKMRFLPSKVTLTFFWLAAIVFMLFAVFGGYTVYQRDMDYNRIYSALYIGFYRFFWSVGIAWILIACITGYGGPVNTILSWPSFGPLARLTYCVYLTHIAIILRDIGTQRLPTYFSDYDQVIRYLGDLVISFGAAAVVSLLFEAPMMKIEKLIFQGGAKRRPKPKAPPAEHTHTA